MPNDTVAPTADSEYARTGTRRALPIVVYVKDATNPNDVLTVPHGKPFLVSNTFSASVGTFATSGAGAGSIGWRMGDGSATYFVFRRAADNEVVWYRPSTGLMRYERDRLTAVAAWRDYASVPQRALAGMEVFASFDPDAIYDYYAAVLGAVMSQMAQDNAAIAKMFDPDTCPASTLPLLATSLSADYDSAYPTEKARRAIRANLPESKLRGSDIGGILRLERDGWSADVLEVWPRMEWPCLVSAQQLTATTSNQYNIIVAGFDGTRARPAGIVYFRNYYVPLPGEWFSLHTGAAQRTFRFYTSGSPLPPAAGVIDVAIGVGPSNAAIALITMDNAIAAANASGIGLVTVSGASYPPYRITAHASDTLPPILYWPGRQLMVVVNHADGSMVQFTPEVTRSLTASLRRNVPMFSYVRLFGTAAPSEDESVTTTETFTVTAI